MIRLAFASLRSRAITYAGAFVALSLGTGIIAMMTVTLWAVTSTNFPGPQRYALAPVVVTAPVTVTLKNDYGNDRDLPLAEPRPVSPEIVRAVADTGRTVLDRSFPVHLPGGPDDQVGHPWSAASFADYTLTRGRAPSTAREIVVGGGDPSLVGGTVRIALYGDFADYTIVGTTAAKWFEHAVFFADAEAARISPEVAAIVVYGAAESVRAAVAGTDARVLTGDERLLAEREQGGGRDQLLDAEGMAGTSLMLVAFVVVFVVIATFAFVVEQRRRELALLRTVGATPRQVRSMVLAEAFVLALLASAVGCALGASATGVLRDWMVDQRVAPTWLVVETRPAPLIIAFLLGLISAMVATSVVGWRAGRVRPAEALREATGPRLAITPIRIVLGGGLVVLGVRQGLDVLNSHQEVALSMQNFLFVPVLVVGGCALLTPLLIRPIVGVVAAVLGRRKAGAMVVGEGALFAARRTAAVAAPVVLAVGLGAALFSAHAAGQEASTAGQRVESRADYILTGPGEAPIGMAVVEEVRAIPDTAVAEYTPTELLLTDQNDRYLGRLSALAVAPQALNATRVPDVVEGSLNDLGRDFLILDHNSADEFGVRTGDRVRTLLPDGSAVELRIAAQTRTTMTGEIGYLSTAHSKGERPTRVEVSVGPDGDSAAVGAALQSAVQNRPAKLATASSFLDATEADETRKTGLAVWNVFGLVLAFALLAIANTLVMAAPDRRRELSALTLVGVTRRESLRFVAAETVVATGTGILLAAAAAAAVVAMQRVALTRLVGDFPVTIPWLTVLAIAASCAVTAVLAAVVATRALVGPATPRGE